MVHREGWDTLSTTRAVPYIVFPVATFRPMLNTIEKYPVLYLKYPCAVKDLKQVSHFGKLIEFG